jgi:predicted ester cyclase
VSVEENKSLVQRYISEVWNAGSVDVLDEIYDPNFTEFDGVSGLKEMVKAFRTSFPDLHFEIQDVVAESDKISYRWLARGTHHGEYDGIAPTGNQMMVTGITILRIVNGRIVDDRFESNMHTVPNQLRQP